MHFVCMGVVVVVFFFSLFFSGEGVGRCVNRKLIVW